MLVGHRGACAYEPENTLRSFKKAIELGANAVEFDIRRTKDGQIAVIHDPTLGRTTNAKGRVRNFTLDELKKLDAGKGEKIPSLKEALNFLNGKCKIIVELKETGFEEEVLKQCEGIKNILFVSFHAEAIKKIKSLNQGAETGFLFSDRIENLENFISMNKIIKSDWLGGRYTAINKELVKEAKKNGFGIFVWTVNEKKKISRYAKMGVDGIVSNKPDLFYELK